MCTHKHKIRNPYSHREMWVDCGKCDACKQKRANARANQIRLHNNGLSKDYYPWFFHLTYLNECVPYVRRDDIRKYNEQLSLGVAPDPVPVYRDYDRSYRRFKSASTKRRIYKLVYSRLSEPVDYLDMIDSNGVPFSEDLFDADALPQLQDTYRPRLTTLSMSDKIGVCLTRDAQNFFKKLNQYLVKNGIPKDYSYWYCFEYGGEKFRPHIHVLLWCRRDYKDAFKAAALKSWTYAYRYRTEENFQRAICPSKYVATYVNKPGNFPSLLSSHSFREKCSHSQGFATTMRCFQLDEILRKVREGNFTFTRRIFSNGTPLDVLSPYPTYVIRRYFPRYFGFSRCSDYQIRRLSGDFDIIPGTGFEGSFVKEVVTDFDTKCDRLYDALKSLFLLEQKIPVIQNGKLDPLQEITLDVVRRSERYGMTVAQYLDNWCSVWTCHKSTLLKYAWKNRSVLESWYMYDNIGDYFAGKIASDSLDDLMTVTPNDFVYVENPNDFPENLASTERLSSDYASRLQKHHLNDHFKVVDI